MDGREKLKHLLECASARINDPATADNDPLWVFWCLFIDAQKLFVQLTGKEPKSAHIPWAMLRTLQLYVNSQFEKPFDVRDGISGMTVVPGSQSLSFEA